MVSVFLFKDEGELLYPALQTDGIAFMLRERYEY